MIKECLTCSKEFNSKPSLKRKFCSLPCYREAPVSEETKIKTSLKLKGSNNPMWGKEGARKGVTTDVKIRKKISESLKKAHKEGRHPTYKGGVTSENMKIRKSLESKLWREAIFQRDDFTCQECQQKGGALNADHIKPFSIYKELRFNVDNGRTLCVECHRKTDTYGWSAFHRNKELIKTNS